ncbi:hypothetical protein ACI65C_006514 [Semiaphis heraclei]
MWAIVHFLDDNSVESVPVHWIVNDQCAWPKNSHNIHKLRTSCVKTNEFEFNFYRIRVLSNNIKSLIEAEEKVLTAQYTSDISDGSSKKQHKRKREIDSIKFTHETGMLFLCLKVFFLYYYYGFKNNITYNINEFECEILIGHSNVIRTKKGKISTSGDTIHSKLKTKEYKSKDLLTKVESSESDDNMSDISSNSADHDSDKDKEYIPKNKSNNLTYDNNSDEEIIIVNSTENNDSNIVENHIKKVDYLNTNKAFPLISCSSASVDNTVLKNILNYLAYLKVEVTKISDTQQEIIQAINNSNSANFSILNSCEIDYFVTAWPVPNHEELNNLETKLQANEHDFKNQVMLELLRVGGKSAKQMIQKIMKKVFSDFVLKDFTYFGLRNKYNFSSLLINRVIFDATKQSKFQNIKDDEIIAIIGKWLTTAKARIENKKHTNDEINLQ